MKWVFIVMTAYGEFVAPRGVALEFTSQEACVAERVVIEQALASDDPEFIVHIGECRYVDSVDTKDESVEGD